MKDYAQERGREGIVLDTLGSGRRGTHTEESFLLELLGRLFPLIDAFLSVRHLRIEAAPSSRCTRELLFTFTWSSCIFMFFCLWSLSIFHPRGSTPKTTKFGGLESLDRWKYACRKIKTGTGPTGQKKLCVFEMKKSQSSEVSCDKICDLVPVLYLWGWGQQGAETESRLIYIN